MKHAILAAALKIAERDGLSNVTRINVATSLGVSEGAINYHYKTMATLRRAVLRTAIKEGCLPIIAEALARKDPAALKVPDALKQRAAATLTT